MIIIYVRQSPSQMSWRTKKTKSHWSCPRRCPWTPAGPLCPPALPGRVAPASGSWKDIRTGFSSPASVSPTSSRTGQTDFLITEVCFLFLLLKLHLSHNPPPFFLITQYLLPTHFFYF